MHKNEDEKISTSSGSKSANTGKTGKEKTGTNGTQAEFGTRADEVDNTAEVSFRYEDIVEAMKSDLNTFASVSLPKEIQFPFPSLYLYLWMQFTGALFKVRDFSKFALALPRGHGKTMFIKFLVLYVILFTKRRFVAVICAKQELAASIIADVCDMLDEKNIQAIFGNWAADREKNAAETKIFYFRGRSIILRAEGEGTSFRGVNKKNARPDVMIFDDSQTYDCSQSETQAWKYINWFNNTALKAKDPKNCTFLYVGNMYKNLVLREDPITGRALYGCHLRNLKDNPSWRSLIVGGIKADGTALWEQLQPIAQLLSELADDRASHMEEGFFAEVMNDPDAYLNRDFDFTKVVKNPYQDFSEPDGQYLVIDPSLGKETSDSQIVGHFKIFDGQPVFHKIIPQQKSAPEMVASVVQYCIQHGITLVVAEKYGYQESLLQWFEFVFTQLGIKGIKVVGISRGMKAKNAGISDYFHILQSNLQYLNDEAVRSLVFTQITQFDKMKKDNKDDILDVGYYGQQVMSYPELVHQASIMDLKASSNFRHSGEIIEASGDFVD